MVSILMLAAKILPHNKMSCLDCAKIGQYGENHYWNKASGLMDQLACAAGDIPLLLIYSGNNILNSFVFLIKMNCPKDCPVITGFRHMFPQR